jgi:hypothetical protein
MGGVGKSTIFKQLKLLYTSGFNSEEKAQGRKFCVVQMVAVLLCAVNIAMADKSINVDPELEGCCSVLENLPHNFRIEDPEINKKLKDALRCLWNMIEVSIVGITYHYKQLWF